jgi:hypothetical protein
MSTTLKATFAISRTDIKNANIPLNHIVSAQKSSRIRAAAEEIWKQAVLEQHKLIAKEPVLSILPDREIPAEIQDKLNELQEIDNEVKSYEKEKITHDAKTDTYKQWKITLKTLKKEKASQTEIEALEDQIHTYERLAAEIQAGLRRTRATRTAAKARSSSEIKKAINKIENAKRRDYIAAKLIANSDQHLFKKCAVIVKVSNITSHDFDSPNFFPSLKPILDAATDTGIIWADDNNNVITGGVLFLPGGKSASKDYIFEIEIIEEWPWKQYTDTNTK